jgi:1,2-diacylglycerol 3-beta-galactosyltransferase
LARPKIDFLFFDAGGGHRSAATALMSVIESQKRPWEARMVDLNDILLPTDVLKKVTGYGLEDIYNLLLEKGWTLGSKQLVPLMHFAIRLFHSKQVRLIADYYAARPPDVLVSVVPNFNRAIHEGLQRARPGTRTVTILTDLADYPPHFWLERHPQDIICGTDRAVEQARSLGHPPERIHRVSGMILRPSFYDVPPVDRSAARAKLGLDPDLPTGIVLFGGHGAPVIASIAERLNALNRPLQLILMCGHNAKLAAQLRARRFRMPVHVQEFTTEVPGLMQLADFFIGKPGPGSISEAIHMGLPVIVECNAWTLPQERYNAEWIRERGVGVALRSFREIGPAVEQMLAPGVLDRHRERVAKIENRAVFEIAEILARLVS